MTALQPWLRRLGRNRGATQAQAPVGIWCPEFDLATGTLRSRSAPQPGHGSVRSLVRMRGETLGYVTIPRPPSEVSCADLAAAAERTFSAAEIAEAVRSSAEQAANSDGNELPALVSVVVCTRNRTSILKSCLDALEQLKYPNLEIIVVDNAPEDDSTRELVTSRAQHDHRIRHVVEPRAGLSWARNRGLAEAAGRYVAYTDDDVSVDEAWVNQIVRGFGSADNVGCVTGLVCTASLSTAAELYFDARNAAWSTRCAARSFDLEANRIDSGVYPYAAGIFGTGANCAFDREALCALGGFDTALGAGTLTRGGEDLDMFVRILIAGHTLRYEPSAVVWHHHRAEDAALITQMYGYGTGLTAYLSKLLSVPATRNDILRRLPAGLRRIATIKRDTGTRLAAAPAPKGAVRTEFRGYLAGPVLFLRSRRRSPR
jgi:glycosyltransferase involved in cell wall biosynthesis